MLSGLMNIGQSALNASQAWISVTGNNLANAETEGYSRQYVDQKDAGGLTYKPGAQPLGVNAQQIMRFFDQFLERTYVRQSTTASRWDQQDTIMATVENIFNEANRTGVSSALNNFFNAWQDLALRPDDTSVRQSLLSYADNLSDMFKFTQNQIQNIQEEMDISINSAVERINDISTAIADLNRQITHSTVDGVSNPNSLLDKRDQLVRELATLVDVETIDRGKGDFRVQLTNGKPLVDGTETYKLATGAPTKESQLKADSKYAGMIEFQGSDTHEYTFEIIGSGKAEDTGTATNPAFRVSLDGGKTWLKDTDGNEIHYEISSSGKTDTEGNNVTDEIQVKDLRVSFSSITDFNDGDRFTIVPKTGLYWVEPTRGPENITPQMGFDGVENPDRVTGGKLAAYYNVRDDNCGRYLDELDAVTSTLIWEVNRLHSQGAGLSKFTYVQGSQSVGDASQPLGTAQAIIPFSDRLQSGNMTLHFYNSSSNDHLDSALVFPDGNFDPSTDSLNTVVDKLNEIKIVPGEGKAAIQVFNAHIQDGKLIMEMSEDAQKEGIEFAFGTDSAGLAAALGLNTFFAGSQTSDIAVNTAVHSNSSLIAAGQVNGDYEINPGDNATANALGKLADKDVTITTLWKTEKNQTVSQYYANLVTTVGTDRRLSKTNTEYHGALANDLYDRVASVSGVNMDEEMTNLIKYQHSYTAAAKLITTADQMLETLLGLKQ